MTTALTDSRRASAPAARRRRYSSSSCCRLRSAASPLLLAYAHATPSHPCWLNCPPHGPNCLEQLPSVQDRRQTDRVSLHRPRPLAFIARRFPGHTARLAALGRNCGRQIFRVKFENAYSRFPDGGFLGGDLPPGLRQTTLTFNPRRAMVMTHTHVEISVKSKSVRN